MTNRKDPIEKIGKFLIELAEIEQRARETDSNGWVRLDLWKGRVAEYLNSIGISPQDVAHLKTSELFADLFEEINRCRNYLTELRDDLNQHGINPLIKTKEPRTSTNISLTTASTTNSNTGFRTKADDMLSWLKNHRVIGPFIVIGIIVIALGTFTDAIQKIRSFINEISQTKEQKKAPLVPSSPIVRFSFNLQVSRAKERIRYLSEDYFMKDTLSLAEVVGPYGDNVLDSPDSYDWDKVMNELEKEGYIKIIRRAENNIEFKVMAMKQKNEEIVGRKRPKGAAKRREDLKGDQSATAKRQEIDEVERRLAEFKSLINRGITIHPGKL